MSATISPSKKGAGKTVLLYFLAFFGTIIIVDSVFVYMALHTNSGEVMEQAYEKGLAYNETLEEAQKQPVLTDKVIYKDGVFRWTLANPDGTPVRGAKVSVNFLRPVMQGHDFSVILNETTTGVYETKQDFPLAGLWTAKLDAQWDSKRYKTTSDFMVQ